LRLGMGRDVTETLRYYSKDCLGIIDM